MAEVRERAGRVGRAAGVQGGFGEGAKDVQAEYGRRDGGWRRRSGSGGRSFARRKRSRIRYYEAIAFRSFPSRFILMRTVPPSAVYAKNAAADGQSSRGRS